MSKPLVIIGAGGHAAMLVDILKQQSATILGLVSPEQVIERQVFASIKHYISDNDILAFDEKKVLLVNGIGSLPKSNLRTRIYQKFTDLGYQFTSVIADSAIISPFAQLASDVQVLPGAIINSGTFIGKNTIVNTGAIVEHDCQIGSHNHLAPRATLSGQVASKNNVHFGTGSSIVQNVFIGENVIIGAGATITKNVADNMICFPARISQKVLLIDG